MRECLGEEGWFANPSATAHAAGRAAAQRVELARAQVARLIGAAPAQIIFTSGATEADNLAVLGTARALAPGKRHVISARTEHKAVLDAVRQLTREGFSITWLQPRSRRTGERAGRGGRLARGHGARVPDARQQ